MGKRNEPIECSELLNTSTYYLSLGYAEWEGDRNKRKVIKRAVR